MPQWPLVGPTLGPQAGTVAGSSRSVRPPTQGEANTLLARAQGQSHGMLAAAHPFTEKVQKGKATLFRARFSGLEADKAEAACRNLKSAGVSCFATRS